MKVKYFYKGKVNHWNYEEISLEILKEYVRYWCGAVELVEIKEENEEISFYYQDPTE